ncbi:MAG: class I SAM-dependent methyltransferase [Burkholderiales bacterium]
MQAEPAASPIAPTGRRWESAIGPLLDARDGRLWRAHSDAVNGALVDRLLQGVACDRLLKTDLFDEAMDAGLYPRLRERSRQVVAIDVAPSVLSAAKARYPALGVVAADVRRLPFADGTFDVVVSNSTLDHFGSRAELFDALAGLGRLLRPGGRLLVTLDNLRHPAVALRNALPYRWLERLGLVPYPVGATTGPAGLERALLDAGFRIVEMTAILHCPRALAVRRARALERREAPGLHARFLERLARWERLQALPTRYLTGHYVAVLAQKP